MPKVSIVLPNLNNRQYLDERLKSIRQQTLGDWELIVVDSCSTDGAWEFFEECSKKDSRISIYQTKEKGIYNNLNKCIEKAVGEYVYIATSDDTMKDTLLEKMVSALDAHQECDIAHCKLKIVDEKDDPVNNKWDDYFIIRYFGDLINQFHIRKAPHDGLLHLAGITVYTSLTQLLIRRSLFNKIGMFSNDYGSFGDYEWDMRASLIVNTFHVPEYLAYWRQHDLQVTDQVKIGKSKARGLFLEMAKHALDIASHYYPDKKLRFHNLNEVLILEQLYYFKKYPTMTVRMLWTIIVYLIKNIHDIHKIRNKLSIVYDNNEYYKIKYVDHLIDTYGPRPEVVG